MKTEELYPMTLKTLESWENPIFRDNGKDIQFSNYSRINKMIYPYRDYIAINQAWAEIQNSLKHNYSPYTVKYKVKSQEIIENNMVTIKGCILCINELCKTQLGDSENKVIAIKMPTDIDLEGFSKCTCDLNKVFTQCPFLSTETERIVLTGVESGSIWLTFAVTGGVLAILSGLASLIDKVIQIKSHEVTLKQQIEEYRRMGMNNKMLEAIEETHSSILKNIQSLAVDELSKAHNIEDNESKKRIDYSLDLLYKWMDKGLKILASSNAPDEIKALFPPVEMPSLSDAKKELLEAAKSDSEQ